MDVERGEIIRVIDRGRPKALLAPLPDRGSIEQGITEGWITSGTGGPLPPVPRQRSALNTLDVLAEDREE